MAKSKSTKRKSVKSVSIIESSRIALAVPAASTIPAYLTNILGGPSTLTSLLPSNWWVILTIILRMLQWQRLDFLMQQQQQDNWCWAAVGTSVALYYDPSSPWTQCALANGQLNRTDCCGSAAGGPNCNVIGHLQDSLSIVRHVAHPPYVVGPVAFADVRNEVDGGRPLCARTLWSGGNRAHFLSIVGYQPMFEMLGVDDPIYGKSDVDYATFLNNYLQSGTWTHSYHTIA